MHAFDSSSGQEELRDSADSGQVPRRCPADGQRGGRASGATAGPEAAAALLARVRKLLAKAEAEGVTPDRGAGADGQGGRADGEIRHRPGAARRAAAGDRPPGRPEGGHRQPVGPGAGASALRPGRRRCAASASSCPGRARAAGSTSSASPPTSSAPTCCTPRCCVQMWQGLAGAQVPDWSRSPRAWRRSWLLGFMSAVVSRVRAAEQQATSRGHRAAPPRPGSGRPWCWPTGGR